MLQIEMKTEGLCREDVVAILREITAVVAESPGLAGREITKDQRSLGMFQYMLERDDGHFVVSG